MIHPDTQIGIIGDSISTGAVADPLLFIGNTFNDRISEFLTTFDYEGNTPILGFYPDPQKYNISLPIESPTRVFHSAYEYANRTKFWRDIKYFVEKKGSMKLDTEEYSWGYLLGRRLKVKPKNIIIAAQNGSWTYTIWRQMVRLWEVNGNSLPEMVFIFYTGNDLCNLKDLSKDSISGHQEEYFGYYIDTFLKMFSQLSPNPRGTTIYVLGHMDILQVLTNQDILNRDTFYFGKATTCRDMRQKPHYILKVWDQSFLDISRLCRNVLNIKLDDLARIELISEIRGAFVEAQRNAVITANQLNVPGYSFKFIEATANITMSKQDIANDCFHPSIHGQKRIADEVYDAINIK